MMPISTSLFPAFSKLDKKSKEIKQFFSISVKYSTLFIVPSTILLAILSKDVISIIYGSQWVSAPAYLSFHVMLYLLVGLGYGVLRSFFKGVKEIYVALKIGIITFLFFILLSPILTVYYSVQGAIFAIIISNLVATIYGAKKAKVKFKVNFYYKEIILIYIAAILSSLSVFFIINTPFESYIKVIMGSFIFLFSYLTFLPILHVVTKTDLENIKMVTEKIPFIKPFMMILLNFEYKIAGKIERFLYGQNSRF
jgi:O-antigen/teichoic acid export membrane protein